MLAKKWVIVRFCKGHRPVKVWRDYGQAWGSPLYEVLGYFSGARRDARKQFAAT